MAELGTLLFERSPGAVLLLTREGQVQRLNQEAQRLLALEPDRLVGRPVLGVVVPDDRDRVKQAFLRVLGGQEREWISRFVRGDGATRAQWVRAVPVEAEGRIRQIVMFTRDVTETGSGRPESRQLQALLENLPGQFACVLDGAGLVRYASGLSRTHFRDDVAAVGLPYEQLLEPREENQLLFSRMLLEVSDGADWGGIHWHVRADGAPFPALMLASPYRDPRTGRILGALLVGRDVSAEHGWRFRAEQSERLAAVGRMVAGLAARVRDAASGVEAALATGVRGGALPGPDRVSGELARVKTLADAVEGLAGVSWTSRPEWLCLTHEAERVMQELDATLGRRGAFLHIDAPEVLPSLHGDGEQLRAMLRALAHNALESAPAGGDAAVRVVLGVTADGERVRLQVMDHGVGIALEDLHRVTEPFFSTKPGHAGLGLAVARAVVAGHGGTLGVESPGPGAGTTVTVELPREAPGTTLRFRPVPLLLRGSRSVLIVDDEPTVRLSARRFLERVGYEVREAWSGRSALAQITAGSPPELVVTDLRMGDGSGDWLMEQLARDFPDLLRHTVILTGASEEDELIDLTRRTGCPLLRKPLDMAELLDTLDEVASRE